MSDWPKERDVGRYGDMSTTALSELGLTQITMFT